MNKKTSLLASACLLVCAQTVLAEKHEMEQHGSHEHGAARLTVATTDTGLELALETPAANVFGFEHNAKTEEEHHVVHEAIETLEAGADLFSVNDAAGCSFDKAEVESNIAEKHDKDKHGDHDDHKDEKHDDHKDDDHKDEKHDDHKDGDHDGHKDHEGEEESHSDVDVTWTFKCEKPAAIETVSTKLFSAFPKGFEDIDVEWITANSSGKTELKKDDTITLKQ